MPPCLPQLALVPIRPHPCQPHDPKTSQLRGAVGACLRGPSRITVHPHVSPTPGVTARTRPGATLPPHRIDKLSQEQVTISNRANSDLAIEQR